MSLVLNTAIFSFIVQVISGIFLIMAFFYQTNKEDAIIKTIVGLELVVQVLEGIFYIFIIKMLAKGKIDTSFRYKDWYFSTPTMLISTLLFLVYLRTNPFKNDKQLENLDKTEVNMNVKDIFCENKLLISGIIVFNAAMLIIGYLGEKGIMGKYPVFWIGSLFLVGSFGCLYQFAKYSQYGKIFLGIMFAIWALYGGAFLLPVKEKNISYNILDLFSKNFYGVFLYIVVALKYGRIL